MCLGTFCIGQTMYLGFSAALGVSLAIVWGFSGASLGHPGVFSRCSWWPCVVYLKAWGHVWRQRGGGGRTGGRAGFFLKHSLLARWTFGLACWISDPYYIQFPKLLKPAALIIWGSLGFSEASVTLWFSQVIFCHLVGSQSFDSLGVPSGLSTACFSHPEVFSIDFLSFLWASSGEGPFNTQKSKIILPRPLGKCSPKEKIPKWVKSDPRAC